MDIDNIIDLISFEIKNIELLKEKFSNKKYLNNFSKILNTILHSEKIIFSGVGKSVFPAKNIVSLLKSLNINSEFLNVQDAYHGDIGTVNNNSVVIFFSKSGNTIEIINLIKLIRKKKSKIILITSNENSKIAKLVDYVLKYDLENESLQIKDLPTTSTILSFVFCSIILYSIIDKKKIINDVYINNHPGGDIGRRLSLKVFDLMHKNEKIPIVNFETSFQDILIEITEKKMGIVIVEDKNKNFKGIITDGDIRRFIIKNKDLNKFSVEKIYNKNPVIITKNIVLSKVLEIFSKKQVKFLPFIRNNKCIGIIDLNSLI